MTKAQLVSALADATGSDKASIEVGMRKALKKPINR